MFSLNNHHVKLSLLYKSSPNLIELMDLSIFDNNFLKIAQWNVIIRGYTIGNRNLEADILDRRLIGRADR